VRARESARASERDRESIFGEISWERIAMNGEEWEGMARPYNADKIDANCTERTSKPTNTPTTDDQQHKRSIDSRETISNLEWTRLYEKRCSFLDNRLPAIEPSDITATEQLSMGTDVSRQNELTHSTTFPQTKKL